MAAVSFLGQTLMQDVGVCKAPSGRNHRRMLNEKV